MADLLGETTTNSDQGNLDYFYCIIPTITKFTETPDERLECLCSSKKPNTMEDSSYKPHNWIFKEEMTEYKECKFSNINKFIASFSSIIAMAIKVVPIGAAIGYYSKKYQAR